jgi:hypothetical protein
MIFPNINSLFTIFDLSSFFLFIIKSSLPKVSYVKGIDYYFICCFLMTFLSVIEYGLVSFLHRQAVIRKRQKESKINNNDTEACQQIQIQINNAQETKRSIRMTKKIKNLIYREKNFEKFKTFNINGHMSRLKTNYLKNCILKFKQIKASKVDNVSKFLFPFVFFVFQFIYWFFYLKIFYN